MSPNGWWRSSGPRPFSKGKSGNPDGRPFGSVSIKAEPQKLIQIIVTDEVKPLTQQPEDIPVGRKIALNLIMTACRLGTDAGTPG